MAGVLGGEGMGCAGLWVLWREVGPWLFSKLERKQREDLVQGSHVTKFIVQSIFVLY